MTRARPRRVQRPLPLLPPVWAAGPYDDLRRRLVVGYKDRGGWLLARPLAGIVADTIAAAGLVGPEGIVLVPAPSSASAVRRRGLDTTAVLAARTAARLRREGAKVGAVRALEQRGRMRDQAGLGRRDRLANLTGRLACRRLPTAPVVLVDDVITTGATLAAAAETLRRHGVSVRGAVTVSARGWT